MMPDFAISFVCLIFLLISMFVHLVMESKTMKESQVLLLMFTSFVPYLQYCVLAFFLLKSIKFITSK